MEIQWLLGILLPQMDILGRSWVTISLNHWNYYPQKQTNNGIVLCKHIEKDIDGQLHCIHHFGFLLHCWNTWPKWKVFGLLFYRH